MDDLCITNWMSDSLETRGTKRYFIVGQRLNFANFIVDSTASLFISLFQFVYYNICNIRSRCRSKCAKCKLFSAEIMTMHNIWMLNQIHLHMVQCTNDCAIMIEMEKFPFSYQIIYTRVYVCALHVLIFVEFYHWIVDLSIFDWTLLSLHMCLYQFEIDTKQNKTLKYHEISHKFPNQKNQLILNDRKCVGNYR